MLADPPRTDLPLFKLLRIDDPVVIHLRELSRLDDDLRQDHTRLLNQYRAQLARYFPQLLKLSPTLDEPWLWDLFRLAPLPETAAKLTTSRIAKLLHRYRIRRHSAEIVIVALSAPGFHLAPGAAEAACEHAPLILPRLQLIHQQLADVASRIEKVLNDLATPDGDSAKHRDVTLLFSLPGVGRVIAATMLAEASQPLAERD